MVQLYALRIRAHDQIHVDQLTESFICENVDKVTGNAEFSNKTDIFTINRSIDNRINVFFNYIFINIFMNLLAYCTAIHTHISLYLFLLYSLK